MFDGFVDGGQTGQGIASAEAGVHQEAGPLRLEQGEIARATGRQNENPQADRVAPRNNLPTRDASRQELSYKFAKNKFLA